MAGNLIAFTLVIIGLIHPAVAEIQSAKHGDSSLCDRATELASRETGVPLQILKAIARTESGITIQDRFVAWPWTINVDGRGARFSSKAQAYTHFEQNYDAGHRNIDLGCFQVNHKWHAHQFSSVQDMLDPVSNARYAAAFLSTLHTEFGDWLSAVGAYHSRNRDTADIYLAKYTPILERLTGRQSDRSDFARTSLPNNAFPLLYGQSNVQERGSLFPTNARQNRGLLNNFDPKG